MWNVTRIAALAGIVLACAVGAQGQTTMEWVTVGDAGNAGEQSRLDSYGDTTYYGGVSYSYIIGKYEVTNSQYCDFLNAVAVSDPNNLYNANMGSGGDYGGITRSGSDGSYTYSTIAGRANMPVNHVSWYDTLRFANWMHNGQGSGDTEDGAYDMSLGANVVRKPGAQVFLPSENEWYKAAYYDPNKAGGAGYWDYPTASDTVPTAEGPAGGSNSANYHWAVGDLTDAGAYTASDSGYGTFDQGGNVWEWNEADIYGDGSTRGMRGGSFAFDFTDYLHASYRSDSGPSAEWYIIGFRVALVAGAVPGSCVDGPVKIDPSVTTPGAVCIDFSDPDMCPIPADFFGPGSDPFEGQVCFQGVPLGIVQILGFPPLDFGDADTLIRRSADPFDRCDLPSPTQEMVPIQIEQLHLRSVSPIIVTFNGGLDPEEWDVEQRVDDSTGQPGGTLTAMKEHCNGGTYNSILAVCPRFVFTKVSDPQVVQQIDHCLDCDPAGIETMSYGESWVHDVRDNEGLVSPVCSDFHPGIEDDAPSTQCNRPVLTGAVSRKTHTGAGDWDIDVGIGDIESRSAQLGTANPNELLIVATFHIDVALLGAEPILGDLGILSVAPGTAPNQLEITITDLPFHTQINLAFGGVVNACTPTDPTSATDSTLCVRVIVGDYDNLGRTNFTDFAKVKNAGYINQLVDSVDMARADFDCSGRPNFTDFARVKNASLINQTADPCPSPPIGP